MKKLKEYQYLHPFPGLNQRGRWQEKSKPSMLCRTSFLQKSEKRFWRKQEFLIVNRSSSITFSIIMYFPRILRAYTLHFPAQKLESNLRDSVNLITNPTSSVMKCCERDVRYDHWYFTVFDWVRVLHLSDDKITKMSLETQECWFLVESGVSCDRRLFLLCTRG